LAPSTATTVEKAQQLPSCGTLTKTTNYNQSNKVLCQ